MTDLVAKMMKNSKILEDRFFYADNRVLAEQLDLLRRQDETVSALSKASGITDKSVLLEMVDLGVRPETVTALCLVPIIEVAWADGTLDEKERKAIIEGAKKNGLSNDLPILKEWLCRKPDSRLMIAWEAYTQGLCGILSKESIMVLKSDIMGLAKKVAQASGSFLGLTNPVSEAELRALDRLSAFFRKTGPCEC
jgi:hypothetical protein